MRTPRESSSAVLRGGQTATNAPSSAARPPGPSRHGAARGRARSAGLRRPLVAPSRGRVGGDPRGPPLKEERCAPTRLPTRIRLRLKGKPCGELGRAEASGKRSERCEFALRAACGALLCACGFLPFICGQATVSGGPRRLSGALS